MRDAPANPLYHGNLGVMLYRNLQYPEASNQLSLLVNGGETEEADRTSPLCSWWSTNLASRNIITSMGWRSVKQNRCGEAIPVFQQILTQVPDDLVATDNANEGLRICTENIDVTPSPEPTVETKVHANPVTEQA